MDLLDVFKSELLKKSVIKEEVTTENDDSAEVDQKPLFSQIKSEDPSSPEWKPLRSRSFLTDSQVTILTSHFKLNPFPSKYDLAALAEQIGVNKRVVQVINCSFNGPFYCSYTVVCRNRGCKRHLTYRLIRFFYLIKKVTSGYFAPYSFKVLTK